MIERTPGERCEYCGAMPAWPVTWREAVEGEVVDARVIHLCRACDDSEMNTIEAMDQEDGDDPK